MNRHVPYGHCAAPSQMPPDRAPISKAPANRNDDGYNESAADFMAGKIEWEARTAIRDLVALYGFENARAQVARYLIDELERKRS